MRTLIVSTLMLMVLTGCAMYRSVSNVTTGSRSAGEASLRVETPERFVLNKRLARRLAIEQAFTQRVNGLLSVHLELMNQKKLPLAYEARFEWLDGNGIEVVDTTSHWTLRSVDGFGIDRMTVVAPSTAVNTYRLLVRPVQEGS